jgi:succinate dehydrogenase/fumarate reductase cytochrome b subunit
MARMSVARGTAIDSFGTKTEGSQMVNFGYGGVVGVLILIGDVWAIINILQSSVSNEKKLIWTIAVVLLPLLGLILWFFLGPRGGRA